MTTEQATTDQPTPDAAAIAAAAEERAKSTRDLFKYDGHVHVGPGAEECEDRENGKCGNPLHFHAYCRLPNQFEHQEIRDEALAAKARRIRQFRDPDSNSSTILDGELYEVERVNDVESVVDELVGKNWWNQHLEAMKDVRDEEGEEEGTKRFEHIDRDQARYRELASLPEEEQEKHKDEIADLARHIKEYGDKVDARRRELEAPERETLTAKPIGELITMLREDRIQAEANQVFMQTYNAHEWWNGTFKTTDNGRPTERMWPNFEAMKHADPEVVEALNRTFTDLERSIQAGPEGNG